MNLRSKLTSGILGIALAASTLIAFPSAAHAASGDFTFAGSVLGATMSGIGTGSFAGTPSTSSGDWTGFATGSGNRFCITYDISFDDNITWPDPTPTPPPPTALAEQTIWNVEVIIDSTGCPTAPQAVCVLTLAGPYTLDSYDWAQISSTPTVMGGNFASDQTIGAFNIANGTNCDVTGTPPPSLANQIRGELGDDSGNSGLGAGNATVGLGASLYKTLEL